MMLSARSLRRFNLRFHSSGRLFLKHDRYRASNGSLSLQRAAISSSTDSDMDAVVVGGGVCGASVAYHLAKQGMKRVMLLEKSQLTEGSTWHAAGLTTLFNGGVRMKAIHYYSIQLYNQLEQETGQQIGFHKCGSLRLCQSPERVDEAKYQMQRQGWNDARQWIAYPEELQQIHPLLDLNQILAAVYNPDDGHVDPYSLTLSLAAGAKQYGALIKERCPVSNLNLRQDGMWDLTTPQGTITTKHVINCAGLWATDFGRLTGLELPIVPAHHQYVITSSIPEVKALKKEPPVIRDLAASAYCRLERDGLLFGPYESKETMRLCDDWTLKGVPPGFGRELFESDLERLLPHYERLSETIPCLKAAEVQSIVCGPITYTTDLMPILGPTVELPNYWIGAGLSFGIIHGGGLGKYLADWIINGEPSYELVETDADRYKPIWCTTDYLFEKCRETYGFNNYTVYPKDERFAGRPTARVSGAHDLLLKRGAEMGFHSGWEQPNWFALPGDDAGYKPSFYRTNWFEPVRRECNLVLDKVGIIELSPFGKFDVSGDDASAFIDHLCANNLPKVGSTNISHMLSPTGKVHAELTITRLADNHFFCITGSGSEMHDLRWMRQFAQKGKYNVKIDNVTDEYGCLGVAGPKSRDVMAKLTSADVSHNAWPFLRVQNIDVGGVKVRAIRISYTGELGWELYHDKADTAKLYQTLLDAGKDYGIGDFGTYALNSLRLEKGFRAWGMEMSMDSNPIEAGLGFFIKPNKTADFVGKGAIKRIKSEDVKRKLMFLSVDAPDNDPEGNETIWHKDKVVGMTTSGAFGYQVGKSIAFGYLPIELAKVDTVVFVELLGNRCRAVVQKGPPVKTESVRNR